MIIILEKQKNEMKYTAFISYNSKDDKWAKWLQRKLESYHLPSVIRNEKDEPLSMEVKKLRIFRYRSDLNTTSLSSGLANELDESNYLIVICSPNSAKSEWVGKEIKHFIDTGKRDKIIPFIVAGEPYSKDRKRECFNPVLLDAFPGNDMLGVNINDYGDDSWMFRRRKAFVKVVSLVIDIPDAFNYLWNRYRHRWYQMIALRIILTIIVLSAIFAVWSHNQPFSCRVDVKESSPHNKNLPPLNDAIISIKLDNEVKRDTLKDIGNFVVFKNIPGRYNGKRVHIGFDVYGYKKVDTLLQVSDNKVITLSVRRDDTYGILAGSVVDSQGKPVSDAVVRTGGFESATDTKGHFTIRIPIAKQVVQPKVIISKSGYKDEVYENCSISQDWQIMLNKY